MLKIAHRINTSSQLTQLSPEWGAEIDVRYHENDLILHHDPFSHHESPQPEKLADFIQHYKQTGPLILNIKTEGIEQKCIELMNQNNIQNWFFLDLSMPYFALYSEKALKNEIKGFGPQNLAVRFSEREPIEYALAFAQKAHWVWVDCFTQLPLTATHYKQLKEAQFKICLVSPELQKHSTDLIQSFKQQLKDLTIDAVCTKRPDLWD